VFVKVFLLLPIWALSDLQVKVKSCWFTICICLRIFFKKNILRSVCNNWRRNPIIIFFLCGPKFVGQKYAFFLRESYCFVKKNKRKIFRPSYNKEDLIRYRYVQYCDLYVSYSIKFVEN